MTNATSTLNDTPAELEVWKGVCRELHLANRDIQKLTDKIMAYFYGEDLASMDAIEFECRDHLTAANQRHARMRRIIESNKSNAHYSLKQVVEFEKKAADLISASRRAWEEMLTWIPVTQNKTHIEKNRSEP